MDWLTFWSNVLTAWAWPLAVLVIFATIALNMSKIAPFVRRMKYGDVEVEFGKLAQETAAQSQVVLPPAASADEPSQIVDTEPELPTTAPVEAVPEITPPLVPDEGAPDAPSTTVRMSTRDAAYIGGASVDKRDARIWADHVIARRARFNPYSFQTIESMADLSPRQAVLDAWENVQYAAVTAILSTGRFYEEKIPGSVVPSLLAMLRILDPSQSQVIDNLRRLRNAIVEPSQGSLETAVSIGAARDYIIAAKALTDHLKTWRPNFS